MVIGTILFGQESHGASMGMNLYCWAKPGVANNASTAPVVSAAILGFFIFSALFRGQRIEHQAGSDSGLPRSIERGMKRRVRSTTKRVHLKRRRANVRRVVATVKRKCGFGGLHRQHGIAGFLQHSMAGFLQHAMSWDANAVPAARTKKATRLRTDAVIFFMAIS